MTTPVHDELLSSSTMSDRAHSLREQALSLPEPLAVAYRRRASELELEAFVRGEPAFLSPPSTDADAAAVA